MKLVKRISILLLKVIISLIGLIVVIAFIYAAPSIWRRISVYPKLEKERNEIRSQFKKPEKFIQQTEYKGIVHMHSYWSHDSRGVLGEILPAAKKAGMNFLFFSDHPHGKLDTFPRAYNGIYDGVIFEPGTETSQGLMVCPMDSVILDWNKPEKEIIKQVVENDGLALYVHTEEPHDWGNPDYQAMEIYNIHTDFLDEEGSILPLIVNFAINGKKYSHWALREIFDYQEIILARWDSLNLTRRITGIGAADAHNNQNIRARYNDDGMVEWIGPNADLIKTVKPGWKEKLLLSEPDKNGWAFKFEVDSYFNSFNFINTHVFCDTFSSKNIKDNLVAGRAFIAFENIADANGFQFFTVDSENRVNAIMGDSIQHKSVDKLMAQSPYPVCFKLIKNGIVIHKSDEKYEYEFNQTGAGNYRLEAHVILRNDTVPWVLTNPIYLY